MAFRPRVKRMDLRDTTSVHRLMIRLNQQATKRAGKNGTGGIYTPLFNHEDSLTTPMAAGTIRFMFSEQPTRPVCEFLSFPAVGVHWCC